MTIVWILVPVFLAVGVYLVWYTRRTSRLVLDFARARHSRYRRSDDGQLTATLEDALKFERPGLVRSFDRTRDIVYDEEGIVLFRTVELLDLSSHGSSGSTHHSRVAVTFDVSEGHDLFLLVYPDLQCQSILGSETGVVEEAFGVIRSVLEKRPPRCPLSVTLKRGRGLVYLEPRVTGSVRSEDLGYLITTGRGLRGAFTERSGTARKE